MHEDNKTAARWAAQEAALGKKELYSFGSKYELSPTEQKRSNVAWARTTADNMQNHQAYVSELAEKIQNDPLLLLQAQLAWVEAGKPVVAEVQTRAQQLKEKREAQLAIKQFLGS